MNANEVWTQDDFNEYARRLHMIEDCYGNSIPHATMERIAAERVWNMKFNLQ